MSVLLFTRRKGRKKSCCPVKFEDMEVILPIDVFIWKEYY